MAFYNESKFNMWRACIGTIWIDGHLDPAEEKWIMEKIDNLQFTPEQREILLKDLQVNINFQEVLANITDRRDKAFLVHQMRVISHLDKDFSEHEKQLLDNWNQVVMGSLNLAELEQDLVEIEKAEELVDHDAKRMNRRSMLEQSVASYRKGKY